MTYIGRSVKRVEDRLLLTGAARFVADLSFPHQLHLRVVRSPVAHGRITHVDASRAAELPGVEAIWTDANIAGLPAIDFRMPMVEGVEAFRQPLLATGYVRYVGEPVAVVLADDPYLAEDAADLVFVDIEEMDPVVHPVQDAGRADGIAVVEKCYGNPERAIADADVVVDMALSVGRHSGIPMETRGALARYDRMDRTLEMFGAAKVPHHNRTAIAGMLGLPTAAVVLRELHVGGGFGNTGGALSPRMSWCAWQPCGPAGRSSGWRTAAST